MLEFLEEIKKIETHNKNRKTNQDAATGGTAEVTPKVLVTLESLRDSKNYARRSILIMEILQRNGLLDNISDTEEISTSTPASKVSVNRFKDKERIIRSYIVLNMSTEAATKVIVVMRGEESAKIVWNQLKETYQKEKLQVILNMQG